LHQRTDPVQVGNKLQEPSSLLQQRTDPVHLSNKLEDSLDRTGRPA
jgi:hypothetical protein